jgi:hypothetical protein
MSSLEAVIAIEWRVPAAIAHISGKVAGTKPSPTELSPQEMTVPSARKAILRYSAAEIATTLVKSAGTVVCP